MIFLQILVHMHLVQTTKPVCKNQMALMNVDVKPVTKITTLYVQVME